MTKPSTNIASTLSAMYTLVCLQDYQCFPLMVNSVKKKHSLLRVLEVPTFALISLLCSESSLENFGEPHSTSPVFTVTSQAYTDTFVGILLSEWNIPCQPCSPNYRAFYIMRTQLAQWLDSIH